MPSFENYNVEKTSETGNGNFPEAVQNLEGRSEILEEIGKRGRFVISTYLINPNFEKGDGWQIFSNSNYGRAESHPDAKALHKAFTSELQQKLKEMNIESAAFIGPVVTTKTIYKDTPETVEIKKAGWFSPAKTETRTRKVLIGEEENNPTIAECGGNKDDTSPAYHVMFLLTETNEKVYTVKANRSGGHMMISFILPKDLAHTMLMELKKDPRFINEVIQKMDPTVLPALNPKNGPFRQPTIDKMLIAPEGETIQTMFESENIPRVGTKITKLKDKFNNSEYIVPCAKKKNDD